MMIDFSAGEYAYNSYLVEPSMLQYDSDPPISTDAKKWARGKFSRASAGSGKLEFRPGVELGVQFAFNNSNGLWMFQATGLGDVGATTGCEYQLSGWVTEVDQEDVATIRGCIIAVKGPSARPAVELGGKPMNTVGFFTLRQS